MADADAGDRILCHACGRVWPRSQHGQDCPYCGSDFLEIIEIPPDTDPDTEPSHPDPPESFPGHRSPSPPPVNPWADVNPWPPRHEPQMGDDDAGWNTGPRITQRTYQSPGGTFLFQSTIRTHDLPPRRVPGSVRGEVAVGPMMHGLESFFSSMHEFNRESAARAQPRSPGHTFEGAHGPGTRTAFHHPPGLSPRDADGPQPMDTPLRNLGEILELLHHGNLDNTQPGGPNVRVMAGGTPLALLSALLNIDRNGDAVYSQEELDRVISQLVEQNGNRSAAPPASQDSIRSLPKKAADEEMLGSDGKAECSICMDSVKVGDEVTVLPCTHWFHPQCIEMWLHQHNTCPHCRRGVDSTTPPDATSTAP
ncbi:hypothetical protein BDW59DRAFT_75124 [Aspergillus cavernicola]|uniref:RING-type domain-containing protein n=1 Tax=Aspergillus cavernicola TaxID=176166 RepID=A0ABR4IC36_9EURO